MNTMRNKDRNTTRAVAGDEVSRSMTRAVEEAVGTRVDRASGRFGTRTSGIERWGARSFIPSDKV